MADNQPREQWGSKLGFILAAGGSAVGLGNIWKFPYITGQYGGAAFVIFYIVVVAVIGFTVMLTEMSLGRRTQLSCVPAFQKLKGGPTTLIAAGAVLVGTLVLSYYMVIGGWTLKYIVYSLSGLMNQAVAGKADAAFGAFIDSPGQVLFYHALFVVLTAAVIFGGVKGGIERVCKFMMPALFVILIIMIFRAVTLNGASAGLAFYLNPDFSKLTMAGCLAAIGQAFFSLSLGLGIMITYGSYVQKDIYLPGSVVQVCIIDTAVAFLAGLVVFPAVFAFGLNVGAGPSLTFITLPSVFAKMPLGALWSAAFFVLFFFAAITSAMSLLEVPVAFLMDSWHMKRPGATWLATIVVFILGVPSALGLGSHSFDIAGKGFLDAMDYITNSVGMPLVSALTCLFAGWFVSKELLEEVDGDGKRIFKYKNLWMFAVRFIAPVVILVILFTGLKW